MLELLIIHWSSFLQILLILIVFATIIGYLYYNQFQDIVKENWAELRGKPFYMFFGSFFYTEPGKTVWSQASENFGLVINNFTKKAVDVLSLPFVHLANGAIQLLSYFRSILDGLRAQFAVIRNMMFGLVNNVYQRITNVTGAMSITLLKVREGLKKQVSMFNLLTWTVAHSYYFLYSLMTGPVGLLMNITGRLAIPVTNFVGGQPLSRLYVNTLCFHPDSLIMGKNKVLKIRDIEVNDLLKDDNRVLAKISIAHSNSILYKNGSCLITGDHLYLDKGENCWKRVETMGWDNERYQGELFCLITNNGIIEGENGEIYADFMDTIDPLIQWNMRKLSLQFLNSETKYVDNGDRIWGFNGGVEINGKKIEDIEAGEMIGERRVLAKMLIAENSMIMYEYKGKQMGGNTSIWENGWKRVYELGRLIGPNQEKCYNLIVEGSEIEVGGIRCRDYLEVDDVGWNRMIDKQVEMWTNKKYNI